MLVNEISCKQQLIRCCFLMQFAIICFLIGELRQLTFSINIERYVIFPIILLFYDVYFFPIPPLLIYSSGRRYFFPVFSQFHLSSSSVCRSSAVLVKWSGIPLGFTMEGFIILQLWEISLLDTLIWVDSCFLSGLEICCYFARFAFICDLSFLFCSFQYSFFVMYIKY
jgi:hypothetical protein